MGKTIKNLMENCFLEECSMLKEKEEREVLHKLTEIQEELREGMSERQIELLEEYTRCVYKVDYFLKERLFESGVRFGTSYILEALENK